MVVADDLRADLDQLLLQTRQRLVFDRLRCCQRSEKVAKVVGECMKLEPYGIVLLLAMRRVHARIHIKDDASRRTTTMNDIVPPAGTISER